MHVNYNIWWKHTFAPSVQWIIPEPSRAGAGWASAGILTILIEAAFTIHTVMGSFYTLINIWIQRCSSPEILKVYCINIIITILKAKFHVYLNQTLPPDINLPSYIVLCNLSVNFLAIQILPQDLTSCLPWLTLRHFTFHFKMSDLLNQVILILSLHMATPMQSGCSHYFIDALNLKSASSFLILFSHVSQYHSTSISPCSFQ